MQHDLKESIRLISREKDLDEQIVADAIVQAIISASKKDFDQYRKIRPELDVETGEFTLFATKTIVDAVKNAKTQIDLADAQKMLKRKDLAVGDEIELQIKPKDFGRIAAQAARQVVYQRLRDAEREKTYREFKERIGELITGIVQRFDKSDAILSLGKTEALLPRREIPPGVRYKYGDRLKAIIISVRENAKGPQVIVSRTIPTLIEHLFIQEVPEIAEGIVEIKNIAREAGYRTKIAVLSNNSDVDPVGACVGMKGSRVQMIVRELESEKIDIVPYTDDLSSFISSALNPAKILSISLNRENMSAKVIVDKDNLSLAIGKRGVNARLAVRLTGCRIDIVGQHEVEEKNIEEKIKLRYLEDLLNQMPDMTPALLQKISSSEFNSLEKLTNAPPEDLAKEFEIEPSYAETLVQGSAEYLEALQEMRETSEDKPTDEADSDDAEVEDEAESAQSESDIDKDEADGQSDKNEDEVEAKNDDAPSDEQTQKDDEAQSTQDESAGEANSEEPEIEEEAKTAESESDVNEDEPDNQGDQAEDEAQSEKTDATPDEKTPKDAESSDNEPETEASAKTTDDS